MTQTVPSARPPRLAAWLVELFASADQAESIVGDLQEEFSDIASKSGIIFARGWYRRQAAKTIFHLVAGAFSVGPWVLAGSVLLGFLLRRLTFGFPEWLVVSILHALRPYSNGHVNAYMDLLTYGIPIAHFLASALIGGVMAFLAKGREIVATATLALVLCALIGAAVVHVATQGPIDITWLLWSFADPFATILGGVIVREFRLLLAHRRSHT